MRRARVLLALPLLLSVAPLPGRADFHPACAGQATAFATVRLQFGSGKFTYSGLVNCPNAKNTIELLSISKIPGGLLASKTFAACPVGLAPCQKSATKAPAGSGVYEVKMTFDVDRPGGPNPDFNNVLRRGRWRWAGSGQPIPICVPLGAVPGQTGLCG